jgi:hypothetical protein
MHIPMTHAMDLAATGFSALFILFAAGFAVGTTLFFMVAKSLEHRYSELFDAPSAPKRFLQPRKAQPIEIELEAMHSAE